MAAALGKILKRLTALPPFFGGFAAFKRYIGCGFGSVSTRLVAFGFPMSKEVFLFSPSLVNLVYFVSLFLFVSAFMT